MPHTAEKPQRHTRPSLKAGADRPFPVKDQRGNVCSFVGHTVSVAAPQLCHCHVNTTIDTMQMKEHGCVPTKLYLQKQVTQQRGLET